MDLEIIILNEVRERQYPMTLLVCRIFKNNTNELFCQNRTDSQINIWLPKKKGVDKLVVWD